MLSATSRDLGRFFLVKTVGYPAFSPAVIVRYQRGDCAISVGFKPCFGKDDAGGGEFRPPRALLLWRGLDNDGRRHGYSVLMKGSDWLGPARERPDFLREGK